MQAPLVESCATCGKDLPSEARFCPSCGTPVEPSDARRAAPSRSERRVVTILFADVVGSTALAERMDPERWAEIMNHAFERLNPAIVRYDGTLARLMEDALLAFFGAPLAHEDDPVRAVRAALDLIQAARQFANEIQAQEGVTFAIRVGLSTGQAVLGEVGNEQRHEYTAMGDAVNVAARLQAAAPPMGILIAETTYHALGDAFECIDRGPLRVKGKTEPLRVFEVRGERVGPERQRSIAGARGLHAPLVGRETELRDLTAALGRLSTGEGGIVSIIGEPGVGKSRLLAEARHRVVDRGLLWLEGHTLSFGQTISYWPFLEMLRRYTGIAEDDTEAERWSKLELRLAEAFGEDAAEVLPYVGTFLALEVPPELASRVKYLDGEAMHRQVFRTARRWFEQLSRQRPVVVVLEDLHWLDSSSAELLEHLLPLVREAPIILFGVSRPESPSTTVRLRDRAAHDYADRYTEIVLQSLSEADSETLVSHLLVFEARNANVRDLIRHKAEGNPFFVEEVLRSLVQQRAIAWDESAGGVLDAWTTSPSRIPSRVLLPRVSTGWTQMSGKCFGSRRLWDAVSCTACCVHSTRLQLSWTDLWRTSRRWSSFVSEAGYRSWSICSATR